MPGQFKRNIKAGLEAKTEATIYADEPATGESKKEEAPSTPGSSWLSLFLLVAHNVVIVIMMRDSQTTAVAPAKKRYLATVAVFMAEVVKMVTAFFLVAWEERGVVQGMRVCYGACTANLREMMQLSVPGFLYAVQNNLLFIALAHLPAALYAVSYQLKILTTAGFSVMMLNRRLSTQQWVALMMLTYGVALMQSGYRHNANASLMDNSRLLGFSAVLGACLTSSFAGVYMEKLLKETSASLWLRNVQLAAVGAPLTLAVVLWCDGARVQEAGLFQGFDATAWSIVVVNALGGLIIAAVLRYSDNIIKCFASAAAILCVCMISNLKGEYEFDPSKVIGTSCVIGASLLYGIRRPSWSLRFFFELTSDVQFGVVGFILTAVAFVLLWSSLPAVHYETLIHPTPAYNLTWPPQEQHVLQALGERSMKLRGGGSGGNFLHLAPDA
jgi:UDP-sugar transporter A1/2/3